MLKAFGARVIVTPTAVAPEHPESYYSVAARIHRETPNSVLPNQYANPMNPKSGVEMTRPLCPYPEVAKYKGSGDMHKASSFVCAMER